MRRGRLLAWGAGLVAGGLAVTYAGGTAGSGTATAVGFGLALVGVFLLILGLT